MTNYECSMFFFFLLTLLMMNTHCNLIFTLNITPKVSMLVSATQTLFTLNRAHQILAITPNNLPLFGNKGKYSQDIFFAYLTSHVVFSC